MQLAPPTYDPPTGGWRPSPPRRAADTPAPPRAGADAHPRTRVLAAVAGAAEPLSIPALAAAAGLRYRAAWEAVRRLHAAGAITPTADGRRWASGAGVGWAPAAAHQLVLAVLPSRDNSPITLRRVAALADLTPRTASVTLGDLQAAGLAGSERRGSQELNAAGRPTRRACLHWWRTYTGDAALRRLRGTTTTP